MELKPNDNYYRQPRLDVLAHVPASVKTLLDVGCGAGIFSAELKKREQIEIWGVEINEKIAPLANKHVDYLYVGDITKIVEELPQGYFDCIVCNDILEHVYDPAALLVKFKPKLNKSGILICSIPNIRFIRVLKDLLLKKQWEYTESGILDFTHVRFFTKSSIITMFNRSGFDLVEIIGLRPKKVSFLFWLANFLTGGLLEDTRFPQFLCKARPRA